MKINKSFYDMITSSPDDEGKSTAQLERDRIEVTTTEPNESDSGNKNDETKISDEDEETNQDKDQEQETEEEAELEETEETDEQKEEKLTRKEKRNEARRIARLTAQNSELQRQLKELELKLTPAEQKQLTDDDVRALAEIEAERIANEREFNAICNKLADNAEKIDKEFPKKVKELGDEIGPIPTFMIGVLNDLSNGGAVLSHLANDLDEAEKLYKMTPARMTIALSKISDKLRPKPKQISRVPQPNNIINGDGRNAAISYSDKDDDRTWIEKRNREAAEKRKVRGY
jgi:chromosome segregation ATPase